MKHKLTYLTIIILIIITCGCICNDLNYKKEVRTYTNNNSSNVSFIIYIEVWQNLTVIKTNSSEIKIVESFNIPKSWVYSDKYIRDYVKFKGNETSLTVYINMKTSVDSFTTRDANAHIDIYIPDNTNYTINYVDSHYNFSY